MTKKNLAIDLLQYLIMPDSLSSGAKKILREEFANARVQVQQDGSKKYFNYDGNLVDPAAPNHPEGETANITLPMPII